MCYSCMAVCFFMCKKHAKQATKSDTSGHCLGAAVAGWAGHGPVRHRESAHSANEFNENSLWNFHEITVIFTMFYRVKIYTIFFRHDFKFDPFHEKGPKCMISDIYSCKIMNFGVPRRALKPVHILWYKFRYEFMKMFSEFLKKLWIWGTAGHEP